jgi:peptidyl-prolyl cis-trans isomerase C
MRYVYKGLSLAVVLVAWSSARAQAPVAPKGEENAAPAVAATVNGQPIYEALIQRYLERVPPARRAEARADHLNAAIDDMLVEQYLAQLQVPVDAAAVEKKLDEWKAELKKAGKEFAKVLQEMRLSEAELRGHLMAELRWEKFAGERAADAVLRQQFEANKVLFDGTMVQARHILLTPPANDPQAVEAARRQLAAIKKEIEDKVTAGMAKVPADADNLTREKARTSLIDEVFGQAARDKSVCPSKTQGGDVGWFQRSGIMVEPFARAAFALKPYTMSDVVQTRFGVHLILLTNRKNGQEVKFEDVKDEVRDNCFERLREAVVAQMRPRSRIEITTVKP